jgi:hypothetical protein
MKFPEVCLQSLVDDGWWVEDIDEIPKKGQLRWAIVPHAGVVPYRLETTGRVDPTNHSSAGFEVTSFKVGDRPRDQSLPIAGLQNYAGESYSVHRAKVRPVLILASDYEEVERIFSKRQLRYQTTSCMLIAPYYGADPKGRSGFKPEFVSRIQQLRYRQYFWDILPDTKSVSGSILRFDHILPIGRDDAWSSSMGYRLSDEAITYLEMLLDWNFKGEVAELLSDTREILQEEAK